MQIQSIIVLLVLLCFLLVYTGTGTDFSTERNVPVTSEPLIQTRTEKDTSDNAKEPMKLPPSSSGGSMPKLDLSAGARDLTSELGPLVINKDGTTSRITNWGKMSSSERERTFRIISARNRERMARLKEEL